MPHLIQKQTQRYGPSCLKIFLLTMLLMINHISSIAGKPEPTLIRYAPNPSYDNIPIAPGTWEEVDLIDTNHPQNKKYTNTIQLLRPIKWLKRHHMTTIGTRLIFSIPEFGIIRTQVLVSAIKPTHIDTRGIDWSKQKTAPVIGTFKRYTSDIRTYTFRSSNGHMTQINATPNHPFYIQDKQAFVAIKKINNTNKLLSIGNGNTSVIHLMCSHGRHHACGAPYRSRHKYVAVYNHEIYKYHTYAVGNEAILVHNVCTEKDPILATEIEGEKYILSRRKQFCVECAAFHPRLYGKKVLLS